MTMHDFVRSGMQIYDPPKIIWRGVSYRLIRAEHLADWRLLISVIHPYIILSQHFGQCFESILCIGKERRRLKITR